jgi:hypothetical protein
MNWQDTKGMCVSIRFPSGGNYAVGPMEMDEAGRILFRMMVPSGGGEFAYARIVLEGVSAGDRAETLRRMFIAGLASDPSATTSVAETPSEALATA